MKKIKIVETTRENSKCKKRFTYICDSLSITHSNKKTENKEGMYIVKDKINMYL